MTTAVSGTTSSTTSTDLSAGVSNLSDSYSTFLTLLTTQLQNQDPTSPMDTNQFTQQLVSMTGVQQQLLTNELLQQMVTNSSSASVAASVNLIGQNVSATTANSTLSGGQATWTYKLPSTATTGTATISDSSGNAVWTGSLSNLASGNNTFNWNGKSLNGTQLPDGGTYSLAVSAQDSSGASVTPTISISGVVKSLQTVNGVAEASVGGTLVPITSISAVTGS